MLHKRRTDTGSAMGGVDEQCLYLPAVDQHEGQRIVIFVNSQQEWRLRQEIRHHFVNGETVFRRQKMVRSVNRSSPNLDHAVALTWAGRSNCYRAHLNYTARVEQKIAEKVCNAPLILAQAPNERI